MAELTTPFAEVRRAKRSTRLREVFPNAYTREPRGTALGELLDTVGAGLAELDEALQQAMHDRWLALASGEPFAQRDGGPAGDGAAEAVSPLEHLGRAIGFPRLPKEDTETYRFRLRTTAAILQGGLTSPRALLELAAAVLGCETCPKRVHDAYTTRAWGVRPGTRAICPNCNDPAKKECFFTQERTFPMTLVDNPADTRALTQGPLRVGQDFEVRSESLRASRPIVSITAQTADVRYPALVNRTTGETVLFAGSLAQGKKLVIVPPHMNAEGETVPPKAWIDASGAVQTGIPGAFGASDFAQSAGDLEPVFAGEGVGEGEPDAPRAGAVITDVSYRIYFMAGDAQIGSLRFAATEEDNGPFFAGLGEARVSTPTVPPGTSTWRYRAFTLNDLSGRYPDFASFDDDDSSFAAPGEEDPSVFVDAGEVSEDARSLRGRFPDAPTEPPTGRIVADLSWTVLPPATFRVQIPRTPWVQEADERDALNLVVQTIQWARAAGVRAHVDFPAAERFQETQPRPADETRIAPRMAWREDAAPAERGPTMRVASALGERQPHTDERVDEPDGEARAPFFAAVLDHARLSWSHLAPPEEEPEPNEEDEEEDTG